MKEDIIVWRVASLLSASRLLSTLFSKHTTFTSEVSATWNYKAKQNKKKAVEKDTQRGKKYFYTKEGKKTKVFKNEQKERQSARP